VSRGVVRVELDGVEVTGQDVPVDDGFERRIVVVFG
jgi:hypothetical protein